MPRTGRPRKPTALKKAQGTLRPGRVLKNEWQPPVGAPDCPKTLKGEALAEWKRVVPLLMEARILTVADRTALESYCLAIGLWHTYMEVAEKEPMVGGGRNSDPDKVNPAAKLALQALEAANRLGANFGLNPSARSKVPAAPPADSEDPVKAFLFGSRAAPGHKDEAQRNAEADLAELTIDRLKIPRGDA